MADLFGPESIARAKRACKKIHRIRIKETGEQGELLKVLPGGWLKVKLDNATHPHIGKRSEVRLYRPTRKRNPTPFFCADCDRELKGDVVTMRDGRVVCKRCAAKAREKHAEKSQAKLFDDQGELFRNAACVRNVEMGFIDPVGQFHPIRASEDYNEFRTTDVASPAERRGRAAAHQSKRSADWYAADEKKRARAFSGHAKSLSQFVRRRGGIAPGRAEDLTGELRLLGRRESGTTGLLNKSNKVGRHRFTAEHMMDAANTEGYRDRHGHKFSHIGAFLGAVGDDASGGKKLFREQDLSTYYNPMKAAKSKGQRSKGQTRKARRNVRRGVSTGSASDRVKCPFCEED